MRATTCTRHALHRRIETVETEFGPVRVKTGLWGDEPVKRSPEYDDCARIAHERGVPLAVVFAAASAAATR